MTDEDRCPACEGSGRIEGEVCWNCKGAGTLPPLTAEEREFQQGWDHEGDE